jgi:hypothetical protein
MPVAATYDSRRDKVTVTIGQHDINRNDPIGVTLPKLAKASTVVIVVCRCRQWSC